MEETTPSGFGTLTSSSGVKVNIKFGDFNSSTFCLYLWELLPHLHLTTTTNNTECDTSVFSEGVNILDDHGKGKASVPLR